MKISEFIKAYNLHDSLLEKVEYDSEKKIVEIMIDFCYWQQTGYNDNDPETGLISSSLQMSARFILFHMKSTAMRSLKAI